MAQNALYLAPPPPTLGRQRIGSRGDEKGIFLVVIHGIYGREMYETWYQMSVMLESGVNIKPIITHRFHYTDFEQGFAAMESGDCGKVVLDWTA